MSKEERPIFHIFGRENQRRYKPNNAEPVQYAKNEVKHWKI